MTGLEPVTLAPLPLCASHPAYSEARNAILLSSILDLRLIAHMRSYFLDKRGFVDGLGDIAGTAGGQRFLAIALHRI